MPRAVNFYRTETGRCPVEEFLDGLPSAVAQKVLWVLKLIKDLDVIPKQYFKKLPGTEDIWECRVVHAGNTYRLLGFFDSGGILILTNGITKKTPRVTRRDISHAESLKADHLRRR